MRIIFAMTVALGISAPDFNINAASNDTLGRYHIATAINPSETLKLLKDSVQSMREEAARAPREEAVPPSRDDAAPREAALDDGAGNDKIDLSDDLPITVPIEQVCEAVARAANDHGLPIGFFARLLWQESRFDQWARSHAGARGLAQFMPPTAAEYGLRDPFDPIKSAAASARFLRELRDQFGNLGLAAAAYNAGGGRIRKWLNGQSGLPEETRNYVQIITGQPAQRWTVQKPLQVQLALPRRAPCEGVDGLSRTADAATHHVHLTELARDLIEEAEEARRRAKIAAAQAKRNKRLAAKSTKGRKLAAAAQKRRIVVASAK